MPTKHLILSSLLPLVLLAGACSDGDSAAEDDTSATSTAPESSVTEDPTAAASAGVDEAASITNAGDALGTPPTGDTAALNITQIAAGTAELSTLTRSVIKGGLLATLRDGGPFTVFAPTNEAFAAVPVDTLNAILADPAQLTDLLTLHVLPGEYTSEDLISLDGSTVETVQGGKLAVSVDGDTITVGDATITAPDVPASNGVVHIVDTVITAPAG